MANAAQAPGAGRAERVREYLRTQRSACTARELVDALEPGTRIENMLASLNTLVKGGHLARILHGGHPHFAHVAAVAAAASHPAIEAPPAANDERQPTASAKVRAWMATAGRPVTSREVLQGALPGHDIRVVSGLLASMRRKGHVEHQGSRGNAMLFVLARPARTWGQPAKPRVPSPPRPRRASAPREPKPKAAKPKATTATKPAPPPRLVRGPEITVRDVPRGLAPARAPAAPRCAPPSCALDGIPDAQLTASNRIAADIAAFEANGGRIERLGPTQFFQHIGTAANHFPPRRPRTGTTDQDD